MEFEKIKISTSDEPGKGLIFDDSDVKLTQMFEESKKHNEEARKEKLTIPEEVKPGSAEMVFYTMRNTIIVNEEVANKAIKNHTPDRRLESLIEGQKKQQDLLRSILKENMSTMEAYEVIQQKIDLLEKMLIKNEHSVTDADMKAAKDLASMLLDEVSRDGQK